jgi:hypothetical protein
LFAVLATVSVVDERILNTLCAALGLKSMQLFGDPRLVRAGQFRGIAIGTRELGRARGAARKAIDGVLAALALAAAIGWRVFAAAGAPAPSTERPR